YAVMPEGGSTYFIILQILIYLWLIYWVFKINHIVQNKESYSEEIDEKGKETMESAKRIK
ncbi:hypothetical protein ACT453_57750, partial [Bacillus sp. D-CC]